MDPTLPVYKLWRPLSMTEKEKAKLLARAEKLNPKPMLLPSGAWRCRVTVDGRRVSATADTPEAANAEALSLKHKFILRQKEVETKSLTLEQAIEYYIESKSEVLSPATIRGYEQVKKLRFRNLMGRKVSSITKADVQAAVNNEVRTVSAKTVANAYGLVRPVLKDYGVDVFGVKLPQRIKPQKKYMQPEELEKLIEAAKGDLCETEILIAAWLGMRRSEIIGLHWDCVDFEKNTLSVRRTVVPDKDHQWVVKDGAKNISSQRTIDCPPYIMEQLRARYMGQSGQIFRIHPDTLRRHIHAVCKKAGITDTTVHGLRHTNAAVMNSLGVDDAYAMARGGWTNEATYKQTYSYVFDQAAKDADKSINDFFSKKIKG